ncbi:AMP-binding protein [Myxococcota bacterium]|nr:AMP-binding protein [Myxococcota bacterium]
MYEVRAPQAHGVRPALWHEGRVITHEELADAVEALAGSLRDRGPGLVLAFCRGRPGTVLGLLAARAAGLPVALVDANLAAPQRRALVEAYRPEWILDDRPEDDAVERLPVEDAVLGRRPGPPGPAPHPDLALLLSTSGTTGSPKLVRLSAAAVAHNARAIAAALDLGPEERALQALPLHYSYGLSVLHSHLVAGGSVALTERSPMERGWWQDLADAGCTSLPGVPTGWRHLLRLGLLDRAPPGLRTCTQAGGRLEPERVRLLASWAAARGGDLRVMYGQTEATARIAVMPPGASLRRPEAAGRVLAGGALWIEAPGSAGPERPPEVGEVVYRGPNVMMGYARRRADLARGDELQGVLRTGDLGRLDEAGLLVLAGRRSRLAKVHGLRLELDEVEALLQPHGPTAALEGDDELVLACAWGSPAELGALAPTLAVRLRLPAAALRLVHLDALPLSASGKIDYPALRRELLPAPLPAAVDPR